MVNEMYSRERLPSYKLEYYNGSSIELIIIPGEIINRKIYTTNDEAK